jgi:hypothetical protein
MFTKVRWNETARTIGARFDGWWGITRRVTAAALQGRAFGYIELRTGKPPLSILAGTIDEVCDLAAEANRHANEVVRTYKAMLEEEAQ